MDFNRLNMEISVIVPVYNVEVLLSRCIDSILNQTFLHFELILVDDGSTDNSGKICDEYAHKDKRIKVIHKNNEGVSKARNVALDIAKGEFICFCDSDDYLKNDYLEVLFNSIKNTKSDCVSCNCTLVDTLGKKEAITRIPQEYYFDNPSEKKEFIIACLSENLLIWAMWARIFKKQIIDNYRIRVCENCENFAEDLDFFLSYYVHCQKVVHIDYAGYYYYQRINSMMDSTKDRIMLNALNEVSFHFYNHLVRWFIDNELVSNYPDIHFWVMYNQYQRVVGIKDYHTIPFECKKIVRKKWYNKMIRKFVFTCKEPIVLYGKDMTFDYKNLCFFTIHMNYKLFSLLDGLYYKTHHKWRKND